MIKVSQHWFVLSFSDYRFHAKSTIGSANSLSVIIPGFYIPIYDLAGLGIDLIVELISVLGETHIVGHRIIISVKFDKNIPDSPDPPAGSIRAV